MWLFRITPVKSLILIRLMVGGVFLSEGIQKFLNPFGVGVGRFEAIGYPLPDLIAPTVAIFEVLCGSLLILGLMTRLAVLPLLIIMIMAIVSTKVPIYLGHDLWIFHVRPMDEYGLWPMLHESRTDWAMTISLLFLLIVGPGPIALDYFLRPEAEVSPEPDALTPPSPAAPPTPVQP